MIVPPNTTATLTLPLPTGQTVSEGGQPLSSASPHIRLLKEAVPRQQYQLAAGTYQFDIR